MSVSIMWLDGDFSIAGNNWPSSGDQCETNEGKKNQYGWKYIIVLLLLLLLF